MKSETKSHTARLLVSTVAMFGFGFALVPLYGLICDLTGLNGRDDALVTAGSSASAVDFSRTVKIEFVTTVNGGKDWAFAPESQTVEVHPGQASTVVFHATNPQATMVMAQAVPSVAPWRAAKYLRKTECFCFNNQPFAANEAKAMPVVFVVDPELPDDVDTLTLSYTWFELQNTAAVAIPPASNF